jgi:antitoxin ParD1/3/4
MNVSLTPELESYVLQKSKGGMYHSASEVIRQALRAFIESENHKNLRIRQLNKEIDVGLAELERGETFSGEEVFSEIKAMSAAKRKHA